MGLGGETRVELVRGGEGAERGVCVGNREAKETQNRIKGTPLYLRLVWASTCVLNGVAGKVASRTLPASCFPCQRNSQ